jgi:hypothetical protein
VTERAIGGTSTVDENARAYRNSSPYFIKK